MKTIKEKYESDNTTGENHEGENANTPVERLTAKSIIGDEVYNEHDEKLGTICNLMVNIHKGIVEYAVLEFRDFVEAGSRLFAIPFGELNIHPARQVFILNRDIEYLKKSPGFDKDHWPDTNDPDHSKYWEDVVMYYKTPVFPFSV